MTTAESLIPALFEEDDSNFDSLMKRLREEERKEIFKEILENGQTILHLAASEDNPKAVSRLLKWGADVNIRNENAETPLFSSENIQVAQYLIEHGADINAKSNNFSVTHKMLIIRQYALFKFFFEQEQIDTSDLKTLYNRPQNCTNKELMQFLLKYWVEEVD